MVALLSRRCSWDGQWGFDRGESQRRWCRIQKSGKRILMCSRLWWARLGVFATWFRRKKMHSCNKVDHYNLKNSSSWDNSVMNSNEEWSFGIEGFILLLFNNVVSKVAFHSWASFDNLVGEGRNDCGHGFKRSLVPGCHWGDQNCIAVNRSLPNRLVHGCASPRQWVLRGGGSALDCSVSRER
jgi:hypothetical protein